MNRAVNKMFINKVRKDIYSRLRYNSLKYINH